jgi:hypothetical protein
MTATDKQREVIPFGRIDVFSPENSERSMFEAVGRLIFCNELTMQLHPEWSLIEISGFKDLIKRGHPERSWEFEIQDGVIRISSNPTAEEKPVIESREFDR